MRMKMIAVSLLALVVASPAMAQYQPGPNIINGRPVVIGSNGLPLDYGPQTPCGYGQAVFSLIERTASRLDPNSLASQADAKNAVIAAVSAEFESRKASRNWTGFNYRQTVFTPGNMTSSMFDAQLAQCFPRYAKLLNDMVVVQRNRQVQEAKARAEQEAAEAKQKAEHEAKMAEIARKQAEERRAREEAEAKVRAANAAEEAKKKADHEAEMAKIERERQAEIARAAAERAEQLRAAIEAAWNVPFLLNANISEDLFRAVKTEAGYECGRRIRNLVKYDIRSPGVLYGTNNGDSALLRFTQWGVKVSKTGTMTIWGDDAEAQNGFGVWLKVNYSCEVDLTSKKIVNVTMDQGRLPDPTVH
jgi:hypothetical protein